MSKPFVKWVGGKTALLPELVKRVPSEFRVYHEPFVGGGALFWALKPENAYLSDLNDELINVWNVVKDDVGGLIHRLQEIEQEYKNNPDEVFYHIRALDRDEVVYSGMSPVNKAARTIFLNKTCYNGLYRVNSKNQFNAPHGKRKSVNICDEKTLLDCADVLNSCWISMFAADFREVKENAQSGDFIYMDPPYVPLTETSFVNYTAGGWENELNYQIRFLCEWCDDNDVKFMLSNSSAGMVYDLFGSYKIDEVYAPRRINSKGDERGNVKEVIIRNY